MAHCEVSQGAFICRMEHSMPERGSRLEARVEIKPCSQEISDIASDYKGFNNKSNPISKWYMKNKIGLIDNCSE